MSLRLQRSSRIWWRYLSTLTEYLDVYKESQNLCPQLLLILSHSSRQL